MSFSDQHFGLTSNFSSYGSIFHLTFDGADSNDIVSRSYSSSSFFMDFTVNLFAIANKIPPPP